MAVLGAAGPRRGLPHTPLVEFLGKMAWVTCGQQHASVIRCIDYIVSAMAKRSRCGLKELANTQLGGCCITMIM